MSYHRLLQTRRNVVLRELSPSTPQGAPPSPFAHLVHGAIKGWVMSEGFPCNGAKTAINSDSYRLGTYDLFSSSDVSALAGDLTQYIAEYDASPLVRPKANAGDWVGLLRTYATFLACFKEEPVCDEASFEQRLWAVLENLRRLSNDRPPFGFSQDPAQKNFAFCFEGEAFFVAAFHPGSWRLSRRFLFPLLVFNMHRQFEGLKSTGKFTTLRDRIRKNDDELQIGGNDLVADHGERSEAPQYAMRRVPDGWGPPGYGED